MKKILSAIIALVLIAACVPVFAASRLGAVSRTDSGLPFELKAPINPTVQFIGEGGSTLDYIYGMDNAIMSFFKSLEDAEDRDAFFSAYSFDEIWITAQVDWAIDDVNDPVSGWHYTQYWDCGVTSIGYDEDWNIRVSEWDCTESLVYPQASNEVWVLRACPEDGRWQGNPETHTPGVKDQLNPDQYTFDGENVHIDYTQHTAYLRSRFVVTTRTYADSFDTYYYSDWSVTAAYGKDAEAVTFDESTMAPPTITNLRLADYDFNDYPVVLLTLTVTDDIAKNITAISAIGGGIWVEYEGRVKGDAEWVGLDGDGTVRSGEVEVKLQHLAEERGGISRDDEVELRARYYYDTPELGTKYTDWSNIISYNSDNVIVPTAAPEVTEKPATGEEPVPSPATGCRATPWLWIIIAIVVIAIVVVVVVIAASKKKKK